MKQIKMGLLICLAVLMLTGCWDTINLEDRGFIAGSSIDLAEEDSDKPVYSITDQLVVPKAFAANPAQGGGDQKSFQNYTIKGRGFYRLNDELSAHSSKTPYYGHLKILIVSEELAKKKGTLTTFLDHYLRDVNIRRGVLIAVAKNNAKSILDAKQPGHDVPAINIKDLLEGSSEKAGFINPLRIGKVEQFHMADRSFVLPYLTAEDQVKREAGAVIQGPDQKMVGLFHADELQGMEMISEKGTQNIIDFPYKDDLFAMEVIRLRRKIDIDTSRKDRLQINAKLKVEGIIKEAKSEEDFAKSNELQKVEKAVSKEIKKTVMKATNKAQDEFNADVFKFWRHLETKHNDTWKEIKEDWESGENYFSKADINIEVNTKIYSTGTSNQTN